MADATDVDRREQFRALVRVARYRPRLVIGIVTHRVYAT